MDPVVQEFLESCKGDPFAMQALSDAIASGAFPTDDKGNISITIDGLTWMEKREGELRRQAN